MNSKNLTPKAQCNSANFKLSDAAVSYRNSMINAYFNHDKNINKFIGNASAEKEIKNILKTLGNIDLQHPEDDTNFIKRIPIIHNYDFALEFINHYTSLAKIYAKAIVQTEIIQNIEHRIIIQQSPNLLYSISKIGYQWSSAGKAEIKKTHPIAYRHLFD